MKRNSESREGWTKRQWIDHLKEQAYRDAKRMRETPGYWEIRDSLNDALLKFHEELVK